MNGAGAALAWASARARFPLKKALRLLPDWLASEREPPLFLNGVGGLGAPYWRPLFRSRFIGRGGVPEKMTAVLESVVFLLMENLTRMQQAEAPIRQIVATGGYAQIDALCQRLSDLSGLPLARPELHEATALGAARLTGGIITPAAAAIEAAFTPGENSALRRRYALWQEAMREALL